jgi:anaerobic ribonucleoside-triphosphate reductase activating protein
MQNPPKTPDRIRLHHFLHHSRANGPGLRAVAWLQGCTLNCPDCFNPHTHTTQGGQWVTVDQLFRQIRALQGEIEGVTISGGEPLQQLPALLHLLQRLRRESELSILLFSGYTWEEIERMPQGKDLFAILDVLIAGRYLQAQPGGSGLFGSSNQRAYFLSSRYTPQDLEQTPPAEVILTPEGDILLSGINPLQV